MTGIKIPYTKESKKGSKTYQCHPSSIEHFLNMQFHLLYCSPGGSCILSSRLYSSSMKDGGFLYGTDTKVSDEDIL